MNQTQALRIASQYVGIYRWGDGFKIYYPWRDSDRGGARTESERRYWRHAQSLAARLKAELALYIYFDESDIPSDTWREWIDEALSVIRYKQEQIRGLTAREMLRIGIDTIKTMIVQGAHANDD